MLALIQCITKCLLQNVYNQTEKKEKKKKEKKKRTLTLTVQCFKLIHCKTFLPQFNLDEGTKMPGKTPSPSPGGKGGSPSPKRKSASPKNSPTRSGSRRSSPGAKSQSPSPSRKKSARSEKSPSPNRSSSAKGKSPGPGSKSPGGESSPASASKKKSGVIKSTELTERGLKILDYSGQGMTVIPASLLSSEFFFCFYY